MTSREALEFLTEGICNCPQCSKYVECMDLDESESVCENAKFIIIKDLKRLEHLEKENQELEEKVDYYKKEMESEQDFRENLQIDLIEFVGAIKILREYVAISKVKNEETGKWDIPVMYSLGLSKKISKEQYELLERVFESLGEE